MRAILWRLRHPSAIRATRQKRSITTVYLFKIDGALLYAEGKVNLLEQYPKPTSFASHSPHGGGLFKHNTAWIPTNELPVLVVELPFTSPVAE